MQNPARGSLVDTRQYRSAHHEERLLLSESTHDLLGEVAIQGLGDAFRGEFMGCRKSGEADESRPALRLLDERLHLLRGAAVQDEGRLLGRHGELSAIELEDLPVEDAPRGSPLGSPTRSHEHPQRRC